ncbi:hypothetical protein AVEN_16429-1 [Araneus ventricosus]|uniref:Uncharacterized protein n=1 Tax=Araneus ventricosus TaxID=182803 RepID=A0A4Y2HRW0_ARAVE|nr:hypothetical protein AVEN_16429-1 [Araneus ventricosus]
MYSTYFVCQYFALRLSSALCGPVQYGNMKTRITLQLLCSQLDIHEGSVPVHLERITPHQPMQTVLGLLCLPLSGFPERAFLPHFVAFAFVREHGFPSLGSYFSFMALWKANEVTFPNSSTTIVQFQSDISIDAEFWFEVLQMVLNGIAVNVLL